MPPRYLTRPSRELPARPSKFKPIISNGPLLRPAGNASSIRVAPARVTAGQTGPSASVVVAAVAALAVLGQGSVGGDLLRLVTLEPLARRLLPGRLAGLELGHIQGGVRVVGVEPDGNDRADVKLADLGGVPPLR
jgi:hypothetical protein